MSFLTRERVVATAWNRVRILEYEKDVEAHRANAVRIERKPCPGGRAVMPGVYFCGP